MRSQETKSKPDPVIVYLLTRTGAGFNDESVQAVRDLVLENSAPENATGVLAMTGRHLLKPDLLIDALKENPEARAVLSVKAVRDMTLCGFGPDPMGLPGVIEALEQRKKNGTSREILTAAAGWEV